MGYYLQAFICKQADSIVLTNRFDKAIKVSIGQGLDLIPLTEELFDQINNYQESLCIENFEYLTENIEKEVLKAIEGKKFAYVEAEYHGGQGGQIAMIWNEKRRYFFEFGQDRINQVLKNYGVISDNGYDEFLTLGFGLHRHTREWIEASQ